MKKPHPLYIVLTDNITREVWKFIGLNPLGMPSYRMAIIEWNNRSHDADYPTGLSQPVQELIKRYAYNKVHEFYTKDAFEFYMFVDAI